ncbi:anaphase-promoting complex, subunit 10-domain-containing protein, partial [Zopfochytrium polystomum]
MDVARPPLPPPIGNNSAPGGGGTSTNPSDATAAAATAAAVAAIHGVAEQRLRDVSSLAHWSVSSHKPENGVENLRDNSLVAIYADYRVDESYTPNKISIKAGSSFQDLEEIAVVEENEPHGWIVKDLQDETTGLPLRTNMLQIAILANHQNGKDSHVRMAKVFAPPQKTPMEEGFFPFTSPDFLAYVVV